MENFSIFSTEESPMVFLDAENGLVEIQGRSLPENVNAFYEPVMVWIKKYLDQHPPRTEINLRFDYLNSASSKKILEILSCFRIHKTQGAEVIINWFFKSDDEDMYEEGLDFSRMIQMEFNFLEF